MSEPHVSNSLGSPVSADPPTARTSGLAVAALIAGGTVLLDQGSKALARSVLRQDARLPMLGDLLGLQLAFNPGTILSLGSGATWVFTVVGVVAVVVLGRLAARALSKGWAVALGLIWGGALGNLVDRLLGEPSFGRGRVTDFLAYGELFVGNLADIALAVGVAAALRLAWRDSRSRPPAPDHRVIDTRSIVGDATGAGLPQPPGQVSSGPSGRGLD